MARIAHLGIPGSFSWIAASEVSEQADTLVDIGSFREVFEALSTRAVDACRAEHILVHNTSYCLPSS